MLPLFAVYDGPGVSTHDVIAAAVLAAAVVALFVVCYLPSLRAAFRDSRRP